MLLSRHHSSARSLGDVATAVTGRNDVRETADGTRETSVATRNVPYPARTARLNVVGSSSAVRMILSANSDYFPEQRQS
jgi:hypothetical protein